MSSQLRSEREEQLEQAVARLRHALRLARDIIHRERQVIGDAERVLDIALAREAELRK